MTRASIMGSRVVRRTMTERLREPCIASVMFVFFADYSASAGAPVQSALVRARDTTGLGLVNHDKEPPSDRNATELHERGLESDDGIIRGGNGELERDGTEQTSSVESVLRDVGLAVDRENGMLAQPILDIREERKHLILSTSVVTCARADKKGTVPTEPVSERSVVLEDPPSTSECCVDCTHGSCCTWSCPAPYFAVCKCLGGTRCANAGPRSNAPTRIVRSCRSARWTATYSTAERTSVSSAPDDSTPPPS
jgi:hypothetical protein